MSDPDPSRQPANPQETSANAPDQQPSLPSDSPIPPEVISQQVRPVAQQLAQQLFHFQVEDPVLKHVNSDIILQAIAAQTKKDEQAHRLEMKKLEQAQRIEHLRTWLLPIAGIAGVLLVLLVAMAFCVIFLYWQKPEKLDLILGLIFGFATGAFGDSVLPN